MDWETAAVALVYSGAMHCFVSATLVAKIELLVKPGGSKDVTLADGSQVSVSHMCLVPLVVCDECGRPLHCVVECCVLSELNHDVVLGIDWLHSTNPVINW